MSLPGTATLVARAPGNTSVAEGVHGRRVSSFWAARRGRTASDYRWGLLSVSDAVDDVRYPCRRRDRRTGDA